MNSLPQFNPNKIHKLSHKNEFNMATLGVYELGSIFKSLTIAMALDKNIVNEDTIYDATKPLKKGKYTIHDYKPQKRLLKISECILYSSNICFAQVGKDLGEKNIKEYLKKMKLSNKAEIEVPEIGNPLLPNIWRETNIMTFAYGHGIAISPLQFVNAFTSIINGGNFRYATLIKEKYLNELLNVSPGAVTPFGLLNDTNRKIKFYIDIKLNDFDSFNFHPLVNTATLNIKKKDFYNFFIDNDININLLNLDTFEIKNA